MSAILAAALGGAVGGLALLALVLILVMCCIRHYRSNSRTSETNSSDPSLPVGRNVELSLTGGISYRSESQGAVGLSQDELITATKNFSSINLIGYGMFGEVYKGLLQDGMVVAIKRRPSSPSQEFIQEVLHLSSIQHRNLVRLLGYSQENDQQMLIYEYVPNGSVSAHLYGASQASSTKLEFKHRLSIAYGAAKGLSHLHSLNPPMVHRNFKTANVLVDENFIPKVADAGLRSLLERIEGAGPSSRMATDDPFLDPELKETGRLSVQSDVYSFGVFLVELVSRREAQLDQSIIEWVQNYSESSSISSVVDARMGSSFTSEGMREFLRLISWCVNPFSDRRPPMNYVVSEIDRIREKEISLTTVMGEGTPTVTLGSQLFTTSK